MKDRKGHQNSGMTRLVVVVGLTGNQGGSVARRFLQDPEYRVRGLTRNPDSSAANDLAFAGVEVIQADLDNLESVAKAFAGAHLIFTVTNDWEPFFRPDYRQKAADQSVSCRKYAYDVEYRQGKNMADAAARTVETLDENGFIVSTLSSAKKCSNGQFVELYHFDAKADIFPDYVNQDYPALAAKMSCVQTGYFMTSYRLAPEAYFSRMPDGSFAMRFATAAEAPVPHLDVNADLGNFVYAVSKMPPGRSYIAEGTTCSWSGYMELWSKVTGRTGSYQTVSLEQMIEAAPDKEFGKEIGYMFQYSTDPGYDGGDNSLLKAEDIRKAGIDCPMTTLEDYFRQADWSVVYDQ